MNCELLTENCELKTENCEPQTRNNFREPEPQTTNHKQQTKLVVLPFFFRILKHEEYARI